VPLVYYWYLKARCFNRPWNIRIDESYRPNVTIITPTYNEDKFIQKRLDNICEQRYPRELVEIFIVDSASTDRTLEVVKDWFVKHPETRLKVIREPARTGKMHAISEPLKYASGPIIIVGDADSLWDRNAIKEAVKYFADSSVGALTASLGYYAGKQMDVENTYRRFYNVLRAAESKIHSTPLHSGVLQAIRKEFLEKFGLPSYPGSEDCAIASYIAFVGYRAIQADDVWAYEPLRGSYLRTKVRRAQHNILNFLLTKKYAKKHARYVKSKFDLIWRVEWYLYIINPWLLVVCLGLMLYSLIALHNATALLLLAIGGVIFAANRTFRGWTFQQIFLVIAVIRNFRTKETIW